MIDSLDDCLWQSNFAAGCIAHTLDDAKDIFRNKVKFAYDQLRLSQVWNHIFTEIGLYLPKPKHDKGEALVFDNGSSIKVSTSYRGGTLQRLHVSEFGKICRRYPDKAREIVTGAFEAVGMGNQVTLESTAEGREGYFFDYVQTARKLVDLGKKPGAMDFNFLFYPWHTEPSYRLEEEVDVPSWLLNYFVELESKHGIKTDAAQQAWYAKKAEKLGDDMKREYPSTPDEAFDQAIQGAYLVAQMRRVRSQGRITKKCQINPEMPIHTAWDLGMNDAMTIVFFQIVGREVHIVDYLEHSGEGIEYYAEELRKKNYFYGRHYGPHDLAVRELSNGGLTRREKWVEFGIRFEEPVPKVASNMEGVEAVRQFLGQCWFAETYRVEEDGEPNNGVDRLIDCLDGYRKEWDPRLGVYKSTPRHDWASHGYKAFETLARAPIFANMTSQSLPPAAANTAKGRKSWGAHT